MERVILTKYYTCVQNNSGGYDIQNDEVDEVVVVEARNYTEASRKFERITENHSSFCECCGPRWEGLDDGYDVPSIFGTPIDEYRKGVIIYNYDGTVTHRK